MKTIEFESGDNSGDEGGASRCTGRTRLHDDRMPMSAPYDALMHSIRNANVNPDRLFRPRMPDPRIISFTTKRSDQEDDDEDDQQERNQTDGDHLIRLLHILHNIVRKEVQLHIRHAYVPVGARKFALFFAYC